MAILVTCSACGAKLRVRDEYLGKEVWCPSCKAPLTLAGERVPNHEVFISYSNKDKAVADALCSTMEEKKIRCWIAPRDISAGNSWGGSIIEAIEDSQVMVLVYSGHSNLSPQIIREVERAVAKGLLIVPFRIEASPMSKDMEYFLSSSHWFDALTPPLEQHLAHFAEMVRLLLFKKEKANEEKPAADRLASAEPREKTSPRISTPLRVIGVLAAAAAIAAGAVFYFSHRSEKPRYGDSPAAESVQQTVSGVPPLSGVAATKENPFVNSLGMKFVPVKGAEVLFSIWHTRVQDYEAFVAATGRWQAKPEFEQGPAHPAVNINWHKAKAFCAWLTEKEHRAGTLKPTAEYRLPTDQEWSTAAGLENETGSTPLERSGKSAAVYPWGTQWPPPRGTGNHGSKLNVDDFANTSPVGSFAANRFGLFDMSGNVWQWCEDFNNSQSCERVSRGGCFVDHEPEILRSSFRNSRRPDCGLNCDGFRCVLAAATLSVPKSAVVAPQLGRQSGKPWTNSLGMKFVPVAGTSVRFSIWDTRVQDYQVFVSATSRAWQKPEFEQGPTHPAVMIAWGDAQAFCAWLTDRERSTGRLAPTQEYRLPTDLEWSTAVGLENQPENTPCERSDRVMDIYPWGTEWPPPRGTGNHGSRLNGDDFANTSPVGSFAANRFGLFDMSGNVWQWCEDFNNSQSGDRVSRGGCFADNDPEILWSSFRNSRGPDCRLACDGFRCVLADVGVSASQARSGAASAVGGSSATTQPQLLQQVPAEVQDLFTPAFAALPLDERLNRVTAKLKALNPGFDGAIQYKKGKSSEVTAISLPNATITNLWPLRAVENVKAFFCRQSNLADLSPLAGMSFQLVSCARTQVSDLSALRTMKDLRKINCGSTKVHDLSPLKGLPLEALWMNGTRVADLTPLSGMPLTLLMCKFTSVTDLSPLQTMPNLQDLGCDFVPARDTAILRSIKTLRRINDLPAAQFWKRVDAGEAPQGKKDE